MNFFKAFLAVAAVVNAQDVEGARLLRGPEPVYPPDALAAVFDGGTISLYIDIDRTGRVQSIEAFGPSETCGKSDPRLEALRNAAVEAVKRSNFEPASRDGVSLDGGLIMRYKIEPQKPTEPAEKPASTSQTESGKGKVGGVVNGHAISLPKPEFPAKARKFVRLSEKVSVQVIIDEQGNVIAASAKSGNPLLNAASTRAACRAKFSPTLLSGQPVKVSGVIDYNFNP